MRIPPATFTPTLRPVRVAQSRTAASMTRAASGVAAGEIFPVLVLIMSAPPSMASQEASRIASGSPSSPVSRITLSRTGFLPSGTAWQISLTAVTCSTTSPYRPPRNAPRSMTMSTSSAPASTAIRVSASLTADEARPLGKAVTTAATRTGAGGWSVASAARSGTTGRSASTATGTRSP